MLRASTQSLFKRTFTSQTSAKATVTKLSNGVTVATQPSTSPVSSVGVVFGSGASAENPYNNGVSQVLSNVFIKDDLKAVSKGLQLESFVGKEYQSFISTSSSIDASLEFLQSEILSNEISDSVFSSLKEQTLKATENYETSNHQGRVLQHLHAAAFQNTPLALPTVGTVESLINLEKSDLLDFASSQYVGSNAIVVGSGSNLKHDELVSKVEKLLKFSNGAKPELTKKSTFLGSEIRLRDDTLPKAWFSIAAEGVPLSSPYYYVSQVAAKVFGDYVATEPLSRLQGIKLIDQVNEYGIVDKYSHFSKSYKDSGLWGFSAETSNFVQIDDLVHFTLKQWNRLTISVTDLEVSRAKQSLKLQIASELNSNAKIINEVGSKSLASVESKSLDEIFEAIDAISVKDIKTFASEHLWDRDIAISGAGQIEGLFDYGRIRNEMSMMRW